MESTMEDRRLEDSYPDPNAHLTPLTAPTTTTTVVDMTPYSQAGATPALTSYPHDLHPAGHQPHYHYGPDYDWQQQQQHHGGSAVTSDPAQTPFYSYADRPDLASVQLYHAFPPGGVHRGDLYAVTPALWGQGGPGLMDDPAAHVSALASQRFLPGMARTSSTPPSSASSSSSSPTSLMATSPGGSGGSTTASGRPKRRRVQSHTQRKAANVRERRRMFHLNTAFDELRKRLPAFNYEKRLSRIETLRLAMTYIGFMKDVTMGEDPRKIKLRSGATSDAGSDLSQLDIESCASDVQNDDDLDC